MWSFFCVCSYFSTKNIRGGYSKGPSKRDGPLEYPKTSVQAIGYTNFDNFSHVGTGLLTCSQNNRRLKWNNRPPEFEVKWGVVFFILLNQNKCCGCSKKPLNKTILLRTQNMGSNKVFFIKPGILSRKTNAQPVFKPNRLSYPYQ